MRLYNTLTRQIEPFKPQNPTQVTLYTCGPTVYDYAQIGNLRKFIFDDTLRRALAATGYDVRHVMNITDVGHLTSDADEGEDKSEKGARREGKTVRELADTYTEAFKHDMAALNILPPTVNPKRPLNEKFADPYARATDFIPEQISLVERLIKNGYVYQTPQALYFEVTKLPDYGILTGQRLADKETGAREEVVTDPKKRNPHDFAVWFFATGRFADHSMRWSSPWGEGFPGWHLECSAIIHALLGDPIDIHTGGIDHIGTHHPNEMAQTQGAFGHPLAHMWLHSQFILVDGAKMSKSKRNYYILRDITDRGYSPLAYRLLALQAHYRSEINFTWESLQAAQNALLNLYAWADLVHQGQSSLPANWDKSITNHLTNDLDTPAALAALFELTSGTIPDLAALQTLDSWLGLDLALRPDIIPEQKQLITQRESARQAKDWSQADAYRTQLKEQGIELEDTPAGPRWRRAKREPELTS